MPISFQDGQIMLGNEDVSDLIRAEKIGRRASELAVHPEVRQALVRLQHGFRQNLKFQSRKFFVILPNFWF
jgi:cytidylate kinase